MRELPILMRPHLVLKSIQCRKTQTRRIVNPQPNVPGAWAQLYDKIDGDDIEACGIKKDEWAFWVKSSVGDYGGPPYETELFHSMKCPYGKPGDVLWVRESFYQRGKWVKDGKRKDGKPSWKFVPVRKEAKYEDKPPRLVRPTSFRGIGWYKRPSLFMPRWASRLSARVTDIRVERVQDISLYDVRQEGIPDTWGDWPEYARPNMEPHEWDNKNYKEQFQWVWDSINKPLGHGWEKNDLVWAVEYRRQ